MLNRLYNKQISDLSPSNLTLDIIPRLAPVSVSCRRRGLQCTPRTLHWAISSAWLVSQPRGHVHHLRRHYCVYIGIRKPQGNRSNVPERMKESHNTVPLLVSRFAILGCPRVIRLDIFPALVAIPSALLLQLLQILLVIFHSLEDLCSSSCRLPAQVKTYRAPTLRQQPWHEQQSKSWNGPDKDASAERQNDEP